MMTTTEQAATLTRVGDAMLRDANAVALLRESREQNERLRQVAIEARFLLKLIATIPSVGLPTTVQVRTDIDTAKILLANALEQVGQ